MTALSTEQAQHGWLPRDREWTVDDLQNSPDDGLRYELADGVLLVSGSPSLAHQVVLAQLHLTVNAACPTDHRVMFAPVDFQPTDRRSFQPDLLVVHRDLITRKGRLSQPLLLAVEVLSPSTRAVDLTLKKRMYEESGVVAYWVVDPLVPSVRAWLLQDGAYVEVGYAEGEDVLRLAEPFPIELTPLDLLDGC